MAATYIASHSIMLIFSAIFNWHMSAYVTKNDVRDNVLISVANCKEIGIRPIVDRLRINIPFKLKIIGFIAASVGILEIFLGFAISTTTPPYLRSIYDKTFYADPLELCGIEGEQSCQELFQTRFRFQWLRGASDALINGISDQLSSNWGDVSNNERILMVATTDKNINANYKLVQSNNTIISVFSLTAICNRNESFPGSIGFNKILNDTKQLNLSIAIQKDSRLEGRWIAEINNLELNYPYNETTRITVNFIQISAPNSSCNGSVENLGKVQLCRPKNGQRIVCLMNTHVENVSSVATGPDAVAANFSGYHRLNYSSPKPIIKYIVYSKNIF
ncbi:hypothetical protein C2G38_2155821 [Gigaspora rosea]|uniref:Uncharacterized protein n=1 Tax=Gigaspora rosea TaxID=44941 RepID=A0A397W3F8_9GLOM|nr:hypothetical protein C2G38_2155821 [Gigaspora rosea]